MQDAALAPAMIINVDDKTGQPPIKCHFNPKEYSYAKRNSWGKGKNAKGHNVAEVEFGGGDAATLTMQLFFDTYTGASSDDVRKVYTDRIWKLMLVDETLKDHTTDKGRPPKVQFQWGTALSFEAVITAITERFTLFKPDGTPVRATLDVTFQQVSDDQWYPGQNPTSGGRGGEQAWVVKDGDTLASIAYATYGDATRWRPIADANRLTRVRRLRPGTILEVPTLG